MTGVELFVIGSTVVTLADAFAVVGALTSVVGAISGGQQAASGAAFNAQLATRNATIARQRAGAAATRLRRQQRRDIGAATAGFLASGIQLTGGPLDFLADLAAEQELEARLTEAGGLVEASGLTAQASISRFEGEAAKTAGFLSGAGTILGTAAQTFSATPTGGEDEITVPFQPVPSAGGL